MRNVVSVLMLLFSAAGHAAEHKVLPSDCLWSLARQYYGDPFQWRAIAEANPSVKDPHWIYPGQVLLIPDLKPQEPAPASAAAPPPQLERVLEPAAEPSPVVAAPPASQVSHRDSLSTEIPEALSGQYPSMTRLKAPRDWKQDGEVVEYEGREALAAQGDFVSGSFKNAVMAVGETIYVLRRDAPEELDDDPKARYLVRVGSARVERDMGKGVYRLLILRSGDSVQVGDYLSRTKL